MLKPHSDYQVCGTTFQLTWFVDNKRNIMTTNLDYLRKIDALLKAHLRATADYVTILNAVCVSVFCF